MTIVPMNGYKPKLLKKGDREVRDSGAYAQIKIEAFTAYCEAAQQVFKSNKERGIAGCLAYFEPFSGPGINVIRETRKRVQGTSLRAIERLKEFDVFVFNELEKEVLDSLYSELLDKGIDSDPNRTVYLFNQDANQTVRDVRNIRFPSKPGSKYPVMGLAVVDPPGLSFTWDAVMELSRHRLDFVGMLSTHHDLIRNLSNADALEHVTKWLGEEPPSPIVREVIALYERKLKTVAGYEHVHGPTSSPIPGQEDVWVPGAYHLFLATRCPNDVASRIWRGVCKRVSKGNKGTPLPLLDLDCV